MGEQGKGLEELEEVEEHQTEQGTVDGQEVRNKCLNCRQL